MPNIAAGASASVPLGAGKYLSIEAPGGASALVVVDGDARIVVSGSRVVGPFLGASAQISAQGGGVFYEARDGAAPVVGQPYTGVVASRCAVPSDKGASHNSAMARSRHMAMDNITSLQLVFTNWYVGSNAEPNRGAAATYRAAVEYPAGTYTQVTFSGSAAGLVADGGTLVSDPVAVTIPRGAVFFVRAHQYSTAGVLFSGGAGANNNTGVVPTSGESFIYGTDIADSTMGGSFNNQAAAVHFKPAAIIGRTTRPTVFLAGDSRMNNGRTYDSVNDTYALTGEIDRSIGKMFATINAAQGGESLAGAVNNYTKRLALSQYCSHVVCEYGINDFAASRTASQVLGSVVTFVGMFGGKPVYQSTISPYSTSTDAWATTANQTTHASNAERVSFNNSIRRGAAGIAGCLEVADQVESARDSGIWKAGYTADGLHGNQTAMLSIQASGAVALPFLHD